MPASVATRWTWASCPASSHCSQQWKVTRRLVLGGELRHRGGLGGLQRGRPVLAGQPVDLGERAPGGEPLETRPLRDPPGGERPGPGPAASKQQRQRRPLGLPGRCRGRGRPRRSGAGRRRRSGRSGPGPAPASAAYSSVSSIRRYDGLAKPPRRREVRRRLDRRDRLGRVQRVDEHEAGALAGGPARRAWPGRRGRRGPTDPPSAPGTAASSRPRPGRRSSASGQRQGGAARRAAVAVARGPSSGSACSRCQPGGRSPGSSTVASADQAPVDLARRHPVVDVPHLARAAVLELDQHVHGRAVGDVHGHPRRPPHARDDGRRQHPAPVPQLRVLVRGGHLLRRVAASTPRPASTATSVSAVTGTCCPCQSQ